MHVDWLPLIHRFTNAHYKQAAYAVATGFAIRLAIAIPIFAIKAFLRLLSHLFDLDSATWDDAVVEGLDLVANHVLQIPLFLMTLMRYVTPTLDTMYALWYAVPWTLY